MIEQYPCFPEVSVFSKSLSSSSISPSSLSLSVSAFMFCTIFNNLYSTSLRISFHWMYLPSTPLKQCQFFGVMVCPIFGAVSVFNYSFNCNWIQRTFGVFFRFWRLHYVQFHLLRFVTFSEICLLLIFCGSFRRIQKNTHLPNFSFSLIFSSLSLPPFLSGPLKCGLIPHLRCFGTRRLVTWSTVNSDQLDRNELPTLIRFVSSVYESDISRMA